jgi:hypothetical protein
MESVVEFSNPLDNLIGVKASGVITPNGLLERD